MERKDVYKLIDGERDYQDSRWNSETTASEGRHSPEEWVLYMEEYLDDAKHILSKNSVDASYPKAMEIIRKVTAMGVCAMEQIETSPRIIEE
jgi:hypothetical protein